MREAKKRTPSRNEMDRVAETTSNLGGEHQNVSGVKPCNLNRGHILHLEMTNKRLSKDHQCWS
jgi:hypothetical protein